MRFFNNTKYKTLEPQFLLDGIKHLFINIDTSKIESIELNDKSVTVFGIECVLFEHDLSKPLKVSGIIRWFNESSGEGMIRLNSGKSVHFYSCNVVGANQLYPELVTNIRFKEGEKVTAEISTDDYMFRELGLINIKKVG